MSYIRKIKKNGKIYLAEVSSQRIDGKVVQKHIRYVGKEVDDRRILSTSISDVQVKEVKSFGDIMVLDYIAKKIELDKFLGKFSAEILSMVYAHCIDYKSLNRMSDWFQRSDLNMILDIDGLTEKKLLNALDSLETIGTEQVQKKIFETVKNRYNVRDTGIVYDVTNTYLYGNKCEFGKYGKDKDGVKGRPLIQIGLGVTEEDGIPILHKAFDGNIHDSKTLQDLVNSFKHYAIKSGTIVVDRGITSAQNIAEISRLGWDFIGGVPLNNALKKLWKDILKPELLNIKNRVVLNKTKFYVINKKHRIGSVDGYLYLCFNQQQKLDLTESRRDEIANALLNLAQHKTIKSELTKFFDRKGKLIQSRLDEAERFDGYCFVFSTQKLSNIKLVNTYFQKKDIVEKAFRSLKGVVKLRPIRHWLYNRVVAHIFICYLAYLLLALLKKSLKETEFSAELALEELSSMYKVYLKDSNNTFNEFRTVTLTKKQEIILKAIDKKLLKTYCSG